MHILVIGGSQFVGKYIVQAALANNHTVTLFNRGKSNPEQIKEVETIIGDRDGGLAPLEGKQFDAVIDTCGYVPRVVKQSTELLKNQVKQYLFISTISVYDSNAKAPVTESSPLAHTDDLDTEEITKKSYGPLKVLCEQVVTDFYPDNHVIVRPGFIVGPEDYTDRFSYWVKRISNGGEVVVPDNDNLPMQVIDVRDLGHWCIYLLERNRSGIYNAVGPDETFTLLEMLERIKQILNSDAEFIRIDESVLKEHELTPRDIPLWIPPEDASSYPIMAIDTVPLQANGLKHTLFETTVKDTLAYVNSYPSDYTLNAGLTAEKESELLKTVK